VEDSGVGRTFNDGVRNPKPKTFISQTFKPSYHICPILSNHHIQI